MSSLQNEEQKESTLPGTNMESESTAKLKKNNQLDEDDVFSLEH